MKRHYFFTTFFLFVSSFLVELAAKDIRSYTGLGSSFVAPAVQELANHYFKETGIHINYQSFGSGAGLKQVTLGIVDFGFVDMPVIEKKLNNAKLIQFPLLSGSIVPIANIPGIKDNDVSISERSFYDIFTEKIKFWDDMNLKNHNKKIKLPHIKIRVIVRSDSSGTTYNFSAFLDSIEDTFRRHYAVSTQVPWPRNFVRVKGNEGVSSIVSQIPGAIGYVDHTYTIQKNTSHISPIKLITKEDDIIMIPAKSYVILKKRHIKDPKYKNLMSFFLWILRNGDRILETMRYKIIPFDIEKDLSLHTR